MDNDIKDKLIDNAKNNMPDLWDKIESKLENKKKRNNKGLINIAAALAIVTVVGGVGNRLINNTSTENTTADLVGKKEVAILPDLNLEAYMMDKINLGGYAENSMASYADDKRFDDYKTEADNVIYGKVTEVKSYVDFGIMVFSDIKIEVIEDYKGNKEKGDTIILGNKGGVLTYQDFINQSDDDRIQKLGYDKIEDKSKLFVELTHEGIPQYRVGEHVLVYAEELKGEDKVNSYSQDKNLVRRPVSYDYFSLKKLYVNPNTDEVFQYINEDGKLIKKSVDILGNIKNSISR